MITLKFFNFSLLLNDVTLKNEFTKKICFSNRFREIDSNQKFNSRIFYSKLKLIYQREWPFQIFFLADNCYSQQSFLA